MTQSDLIARAKKVLPGGGFGNFDPVMIIREGKGSRVWDMDGNEYIDYLIGSGPMMLGHGHPEVLDAVHEQLDKGMTFFANNPHGIELAEEICNHFFTRTVDQIYFSLFNSVLDEEITNVDVTRSWTR